ncbi:hypothetical protein [Marivita hallyeonensis]|uniref:Uncharacterized protein n=1 Tax=Marivita hallyeonensis TaxID=996342 RepID=A0A1M5Y925_9RHOB|nr:hypothetical protein [Marivita hallyeonensis]SHI08439.1 hypothetical protein SAMN05443551_0161 [Marivita hallyeonensis]
MADSNVTPRKIVGFSMAPKMAVEVKAEAARRELSLRKLFEEMWEMYQEKNKP